MGGMAARIYSGAKRKRLCFLQEDKEEVGSGKPDPLQRQKMFGFYE